MINKYIKRELFGFRVYKSRYTNKLWVAKNSAVNVPLEYVYIDYIVDQSSNTILLSSGQTYFISDIDGFSL